ncbi:MAG: hypothetical protein KGL35_20320 [Bradyrhizobium sp.]|nr:hypothetical protein [Bradyrhizobium sp.]
MSVRCKMRLESVIPVTWGGSQAIFRCEYDQRKCAGDISFTKATPFGEARFQIDNPAALAQLTIGAYYYFDMTPVPTDVAGAPTDVAS